MSALANFRDCAEYADWPQDKTEKINTLVRTLETAADVSALSPLLCHRFDSGPSKSSHARYRRQFFGAGVGRGDCQASQCSLTRFLWNSERTSENQRAGLPANMKSDRSETTGRKPRKLSRRNLLEFAGIGNAVATVVVARWENELDRGPLEEQLARLKIAAQASQPI
jgi:hypothetical protein